MEENRVRREYMYLGNGLKSWGYIFQVLWPAIATSELHLQVVFFIPPSPKIFCAVGFIIHERLPFLYSIT